MGVQRSKVGRSTALVCDFTLLEGVGAANHREAENANAVVIPQKEPSRTLVFRRLFCSVAQRSPCMIFCPAFSDEGLTHLFRMLSFYQMGVAITVCERSGQRSNDGPA